MNQVKVKSATDFETFSALEGDFISVKEEDSILVKGYLVDLNSSSKITLEIEKEGISLRANARDVLGKKIGEELSGIVSQYMGWLFGNTVVVEQILNFQEKDVSMSLWKESNREFHENIEKVIKVRHISHRFGL